MLHYAVIGASSPFCIRAKMLTYNKNGGPKPDRRSFDRCQLLYPFVRGSINDVVLTPSASAWKFSTTR